jgi:hypothetical protein
VSVGSDADPQSSASAIALAMSKVRPEPVETGRLVFGQRRILRLYVTHEDGSVKRSCVKFGVADMRGWESGASPGIEPGAARGWVPFLGVLTVLLLSKFGLCNRGETVAHHSPIRGRYAPCFSTASRAPYNFDGLAAH